MFPLFETIRIEGETVPDLSYHNARMNGSRRELFGSETALDLSAAVRVPAGALAGVHRCRVTYGETLGEVTFSPYSPRAVRSLALVDGGGLDYSHKYADRSGIDRLLASAGADDILIVKEGRVTDASSANVAFFDGHSWITPAAPLLRGTTRARLLDLGLLRPADIGAGGLGNFRCAALMNAMIGFDTGHPIAIEAIAGA
jgi:4-amino-4-deoxychorismate lyase